ncbi:Dienelactone hydrolase family [Seminavis robusta]|uniref:Dienelactone hydrolase family n=1 Tax=Seminavis robusta TaxID=568900 RepID=A0A9N8H8T6_9STRA|nr:Dienelactone hydrolase family [Seminavis robusta]|eukprot:Sro169_g075040.1 Dienelactone hydrolase family (720) ;mRNA; r:25673-27930
MRKHPHHTNRLDPFIFVAFRTAEPMGRSIIHLFPSLRAINVFIALQLAVAFVAVSQAFQVSSFGVRSPAHGLLSVRRPAFVLAPKPFYAKKEDDGEEEEDNSEEEDDENEFVVLPEGMEDALTEEDLQGLTVPQLKQQLRLRGLKVGGRKGELIERLLTSSVRSSSTPTPPIKEEEAEETKAQKFARDKGKEFVDVSEYLDEEDQGKSVKAWNEKKVIDAEFERDDNSKESSSPEVWGSEARIVDDYEGRQVVVDCLSRTVVQFLGSNQSYVDAFVVASRDALKPFLAGGGGTQQQENKNITVNSAEERLREIQTKREKASRVPVRFDYEGPDEGDEQGKYANILDRDFSDWGKYTAAGAQMSATEVQGVLLLSDVYGLSEDTKTLAEKIAFECQPVVVMVPDLFRGHPWKEESSTPGNYAQGQTYEDWRATHSDLRVSVDIRAAAACLRERYGVSSVVVWGTCYGGGRALEAAAGYRPDDQIHDVDGSVGPPLVKPMATVAWYPTRYAASALFGRHRTVGNNQHSDEETFAVMGVFAGNDVIPGATPEDAATLKALLEEDDRIKDSLIKVFPGQEHGFAHIGLAARANMDKDTAFERFVDDEFGGAGHVSMEDGEASVACLLSTAFMETYARVFLPTTGVPIQEDEDEQWNVNIEMKSLDGANSRDVRKEIAESMASFVSEEKLERPGIDPDDVEGQEKLKEVLRKAESNAGADLELF